MVPREGKRKNHTGVKQGQLLPEGKTVHVDSSAVAGSRAPSAGRSRLDRVSEGTWPNLTESFFLPMPKSLRRQAASHRRTKGLGLRTKNGVGSLRDLSACYVTVATQVPGMQKLDATP